MAQPDVYLWRDAVDGNQYWIGIKVGQSYAGWMPVFCDAILDCFGKEVYEKARDLKSSQPIRIKLELTFAQS